jgi:murein DD-endopeptidase MepM/ murein hydrolase activator NlpD
MTSFIQNQQLAKRRKPNSRSSNKSADFGSEFMSQFRQKPSPQKRKKKASKSWFNRDTGREYRRRTPRFQGWSSGLKKAGGLLGRLRIPVPSIATVLIIAATVVISLAALNWEDLNIKTPEVFAFPVMENSNSGQHTIQYAATGMPTLFSSGNNPEDADSEGILPEDINENPHGMLVTFEWRQHRVQRNETISGIAQRFGVSVGAIIASNNISNARRLQEGTNLRIPNVDGIPYQIKSGDSLTRISASFNVPLEVILDINDIKSDNLKVGETIFIPGGRMNDIDLRLSLGETFMFPLPGSRIITSRFGMRRDPFTGVMQFHNGVDFKANTGTPIMASLDGVVSVVAQNWLYGKYIIMSHSNGYKTLYAHLNSFNVKQGDRVTRGRKIGEVGNTGQSTGPHLHFGIYDRNGRHINPLELIR